VRLTGKRFHPSIEPCAQASENAESSHRDTALRIYATTAVTDRRINTLMQNRQYREAIAWQNTAYNQPPHPSFFIGDGMATPPRP
jgi:hypothetical protein